ncbi:hypothetical protein G6F57_019789 [Rhizopus arrhizus]|nr:hypothetical protein G6F57_019789 [Rhizopus arrhizus]
MVSPDAAASAAMSGELDAQRPRAVFAFVLGHESPALEQRHLPVQRALGQAGLLGQRRDRQRAIVPGQRGQHIKDTVCARPYRGFRHQDIAPSNERSDYQFPAISLISIPEY